jgi:hypothetical protein
MPGLHVAAPDLAVYDRLLPAFATVRPDGAS